MKSDLADIDDKKKQEMYLLMPDVVIDVVKCGIIQAKFVVWKKGWRIKETYYNISTRVYQRRF